MTLDPFGTHGLPTAERVELLNSYTRLVIAVMLVLGILYALVKELLDGNTYLQVASMAVMFYLARPIAPTNGGAASRPPAPVDTAPTP